MDIFIVNLNFLSMTGLQDRCSSCDRNSTHALDNDTAVQSFTEECKVLLSVAFESNIQNYSSVDCAAARLAYLRGTLDVIVGERDDRCGIFV